MVVCAAEPWRVTYDRPDVTASGADGHTVHPSVAHTVRRGAAEDHEAVTAIPATPSSTLISRTTINAYGHLFETRLGTGYLDQLLPCQNPLTESGVSVASTSGQQPG